MAESIEDLARVKIRRLHNDQYYVELASPGVRIYSRKYTVPTLADVDVLLIHHFLGHLTIQADCLPCQRLLKGHKAKGDRSKLPPKRSEAEVMREWRARDSYAHQKAYNQRYYLEVLKPKRQEKRRQGRASPLLMHRPRLVIRLG